MPVSIHRISNVCEDYSIWNNQRIVAAPTVLQTYNPTEHKELPGALAKVKIEDTKTLLDFVRIYGLLGYLRLEGNTVADRREPLP